MTDLAGVHDGRHRILLVDAEPSILECYSEILAPENDPDEIGESLSALDRELFGAVASTAPEPEFDVTLCRQGKDAVSAVEDAIQLGRPYSVAFLDVRMPPGIDGVRTAQRIRILDPDINIVMVTGYSDLSAKDIAKRVMPLDKFLYCQKPVQADELRQFATSLSARWMAEKSLTEFAGRSKKQFMANMSHELRTPLNAVIGFAELIKTEVMGPMEHVQYREYVDDIHECSTHLLAVINDILDLSRFEVGRFELQEKRLDVRTLLMNAVGQLEPRIRASEHTLEMVIPDDLPEVVADARGLEQIVINLLSNAVKFTPKGGTVTVAARSRAGGLRISVRDTGIGISADHIAIVLQPFRQIDAELARSYEGTGLGLPLSAAMAELHGGTIHIESSLGKGTLVVVDLPPERMALAGASG